MQVNGEHVHYILWDTVSGIAMSLLFHALAQAAARWVAQARANGLREPWQKLATLRALAMLGTAASL